MTTIDKRSRNRKSMPSFLNFGSNQKASQGVRSRIKPVNNQRIIDIKIDVPLLLVVSTLMVFGLIILYSASYDISFQIFDDSSVLFFRQIRAMLLGIVAATFMLFFDYHKFTRYSIYMVAFTLLALVIVLIVRDDSSNVTRGLFQGSVQPSEFAKLVIIIYLAVWLHSKRDQLKDIQFGLLPLGIILSIFCALVMMQPDISVVVTILLLGGLMFFLAGGDLKQIVMLLLLTIGFGGLILLVIPYSMTRVEDFFSGLREPIRGSYQVLRSFDAFIKGGWFGVGIGKGETKLTDFPVPHTDSIFAVIGEETGVLGAIVLVALFSLLLWRGILISLKAPDDLGSLLAAGLTVWIVTEAFINMAVMVNLLPFAGNALPFISSGGSSLFVCLVAIGIIMNISYQAKHKMEGKESNAIVDLRRRDGGRRISSPRSSSSR